MHNKTDVDYQIRSRKTSCFLLFYRNLRQRKTLKENASDDIWR